MARAVEHPEKTLHRFWNKVEKQGPQECWIWAAATSKNGYGHFGLNRTLLSTFGLPEPARSRSTTITVLAPRFSWALANGPIPKGLRVLHTCDNPPCVNPAHLFIGTAAQNSADAVAKGRMSAGEQRQNSRLTKRDVQLIRNSPLAQYQLALHYGVTRSTINDVVLYRTWRSI